MYCFYSHSLVHVCFVCVPCVYYCHNSMLLIQVRPGTGWVLEKYDGSECSTLISYLAHVRCLLSVAEIEVYTILPPPA